VKKELFEEETPLRDPKILESLYSPLLNSNVSADLTVNGSVKIHVSLMTYKSYND